MQERLEGANAIKKQMWADAQLDKRRSKEEFASRSQYNSYTSLKADAIPEHNATETTPTPVRNLNIDNDEMVGTLNNSEILNQQSQSNTGNVSYERNGVAQEISATPDNLSAQQHASADKTRSQLKSYIGHKAEQLYVYRSLPLGQDRRRNRYWQFSTSTSPNDPGSGRIFFESREGYWRVIDSEEVLILFAYIRVNLVIIHITQKSSLVIRTDFWRIFCCLFSVLISEVRFNLVCIRHS